jgi:TolA-binding protein
VFSAKHDNTISKVIIISLMAGADSCKVKLDKKTERIYQDGIDYLRKGSYNLAGQQMRNVVKTEPGCVDAYFVLGLINFKKSDNNFREAEKNFRKVIELCPGYDVYAYFYLGEIYYGQENFELASQYLTEFLKDVDKIKKDEDYNRAADLLKYSDFEASTRQLDEERPSSLVFTEVSSEFALTFIGRVDKNIKNVALNTFLKKNN